MAAVVVVVLETARMALRRGAGYGTEMKPIVWRAGRRPAPRISTMATSMPSSDVPLMMPATLIGGLTPFAIPRAVAGPRWGAARPHSECGSARRCYAPQVRRVGFGAA